jgi:hypothetical protein
MKAGTTSLYHYLKQHPQAYMSPHKELNFFNYIDIKEPQPDALTFEGQPIRDIETYSKVFFSEVSSEIAVGEATPMYLFSPSAVKYIKQYLPDVKLVIVLRQPVDRAYSHFLHWKKTGMEPARSDFIQTLAKEEQHILNADNQHSWHYLKIGRYYPQLVKYFDAFESHQIKVYIYEDFFQRDELVENIKDLFNFLEIDVHFMPTIKKFNTAKQVRYQWLLNLLTSKQLRQVFRPLLPNKKWRQFTRSRLQKIYLKESTSTKDSMTPDLRKRLTEKYYKDDILKLQTLLQQDLTKWLE